MFADIQIARRNALGLARSLMVATMVIATASGYAVITADECDGQCRVLHEYDPFA